MVYGVRPCLAVGLVAVTAYTGPLFASEAPAVRQRTNAVREVGEAMWRWLVDQPTQGQTTPSSVLRSAAWESCTNSSEDVVSLRPSAAKHDHGGSCQHHRKEKQSQR